VSSAAAGTLEGVEEEPGLRPGVVSLTVYVALSGWLGVVVAAVALHAPGLVGVAVADVGADSLMPFTLDTAGVRVASVAVIVTYIWALTLTTRAFLGRYVYRKPPVWTWTGVVVAAAVVILAAAPHSTFLVALGAGLALRSLAYTRDGMIRPDPFTFPRPVGRALAVAVPILAIGTATAYAAYHPLQLRGTTSDGAPIAVGRTPLTTGMLTFANEGGRPLRVLVIEPGVERGYALRLVGVERLNMGVTQPGDPDTLPFAPFQVAAHAESRPYALVVSRAGCKPGATGRIESVRVRYLLGGERSVLLPLAEPLTLRC
jgi:hypothetical protein